jgi:outer membrane biogenesis lipoprotein LolB
MRSHSKGIVLTIVAALLLAACTSPTAVANRGDCGGVDTGTSTHC